MTTPCKWIEASEECEDNACTDTRCEMPPMEPRADFNIVLVWESGMDQWGAMVDDDLIGSGNTRADALRDAANTIEGWSKNS